ncbi:hypothetical protein FHR83_007111 [Actinoplanes campanulatus]|uniref:Minor tail protein n=1 Tax=Actinoplanes campanulatus TaxID=113559 RepID=A0A7W5ANI1_9ACTN|nr:tail fiber domain-containing protein [Actinoplanes campanulatus]MBB3099405.1 hypothetical protein [Actinoplanes campanulatus]GGN40141.1 hypothetical protein GCM10010109_68810 [Actinoplanes campanulatus]GID42386.1 hypothetical protein Aca09nite_88920 [Actinoplanes campanulatus]
MAITYFPFDDVDTNEDQYSQLFRELQDSGVAASHGSNSFQVGANASGMTVTVQAGFAILRGHAILSTAVESLTVAAASTSARIDRIVLRLDPGANKISLAILQGTAGSGVAPTLTQTDTGLFEISLATVTVGASVGSIAASAVTDTRQFVGSRVGTWTSSTRPAGPRKGKLGFNDETGLWEFFNGTTWANLTTSWSSITGAPATFTPTAHTHAWTDLSGVAPAAKLPVGTASGTVAAGDHHHDQLTRLPNRVKFGRTLITPTAANVTTSEMVTWSNSPPVITEAPVVLLTADSSAPSVITGLTVSGPSTTGFQINLIRTNTVATYVNWVAVWP